MKQKYLIASLIIFSFFLGCKSDADKAVDEVRRLFKADRYDEAVKFASQSIKKFPNDARLFYNRGYCYHSMNNPRAIEDFTNCIRIDPNYHNGYYGLAMTYERDGQIDLSIKNYNKAISLSPDNERKATFMSGLSKLYSNAGNHTKAIEIINQAIQLEEEGSYYYFLGNYHLAMGNKSKAESIWIKAISNVKFSQVEFKYRTYYELAKYYFQEKEYKKSKEFIEKAIELAPNKNEYVWFYNQVKPLAK